MRSKKVLFAIVAIMALVVIGYFYTGSPKSQEVLNVVRSDSSAFARADTPSSGLPPSAVQVQSNKSSGTINSVSTNQNIVHEGFENIPSGKFNSNEWDVQIVGGQATFNVVEGGAVGSERCLEIAVNDITGHDWWDIQMVNESIPVQPNKLYIFSAWVKGSKGMQVAFAAESPQFLNYQSDIRYLSGEWQQVAFEFESETNVIRAPIHFAFPQNSGDSILVDEIKIEKHIFSE